MNTEQRRRGLLKDEARPRDVLERLSSLLKGCQEKEKRDACLEDMGCILAQVDAWGSENVMEIRESAWKLLVAQGYLEIAQHAASKENEILRINSERKVHESFLSLQDSAQMQEKSDIMRSLFDLACLIAKHHYEMAGGEDIDASDGFDMDPSLSRKFLYHCSQAIKYGEYALDSSNVLEEEIEIRTMLRHARVMQASYMVDCGMMEDARRTMGTLSDWSRSSEHAIWYIEELLVRIKVNTMSGVSRKVEESLREMGSLLRSSPGLERSSEEDESSFSNRLSRIFNRVIRVFGSQRKSNASLVDAILFLVQSAPDVGAEALVAIVLRLPMEHEDVEHDIAWMNLLTSIFLSSTVSPLVLKRENSDILHVFHAQSRAMFVRGELELCIKFWQLVLHYGPESRRQWSLLLLYALHVYTENRVLSEQCRQGISSGEVTTHPFGRAVQLLELMDGSDETNHLRLDLEKQIVSEIHEKPSEWTNDFLYAVQQLSVPESNLYEAAREHYWTDTIYQATEEIMSRPVGVKRDLEAFIDRYEDMSDTWAKDRSGFIEDAEKAVSDASRASSMVRLPPEGASLMKKIVKSIIILLKADSKRLPKTLRDVALQLVEIGLSVPYAGYSTNRLKDLRDHLRILSCNDQVDEIVSKDTLCASAITGVCETLKESISPDVPTEQPAGQPTALLVSFRVALLSGDEDHILTGIGHVIESMGHEFFLEFISAHLWVVLRQETNIDSKLVVPLLQYIVNHINGGIEKIILCIASIHDDMAALTAYRAYSRIVQHLNNIPTALGDVLVAWSEDVPFFGAKIFFLEPWKFRYYIQEDDDEEEEEEEEREEMEEDSGVGEGGDKQVEDDEGGDEDAKMGSEYTGDIACLDSRSSVPLSVSHESLSTRKRKLEGADQIISSLLDDIAPAAGTASEHSSSPADRAPWIGWIKRVFSP
jgi:hypothetical protein